jgi:hypothetical protein
LPGQHRARTQRAPAGHCDALLRAIIRTGVCVRFAGVQ